MNAHNINFYDNIPIDKLKELSFKGGFSKYKDLEIISPFIKPEHTILEIGAGYGRCLDFFLHNHHTGKIYALEKSKPFVEYLMKNYSNQVEVIEGDVMNISFLNKIDIALWMWSGIVDFSKDEQMICCKRIHTWLNPRGQLFIDVPRIGYQTIAEHVDEQNLHLKTEYGDIVAYIPSVQDMTIVKQQAGYTSLDVIEYDTSTDKKRTIYVLKK
jgi:tRNA A58 N-methylase Trm61